MPATIITTDDLREFKMELLDDIKNLLSKQTTGKLKKYLKSSEVMDLLQTQSRDITESPHQRNIAIHKSWGHYLL